MKLAPLALSAATLLLAAAQASAHFGMVIPSTNIVTQEDRNIEVDISFSHPFEGIGMEMARPARFEVRCEGNVTDLGDNLEATTIMGHQGWHYSGRIRRPCVSTYVMEPQPYWEPAEDLFIVHYTKTIVAAFGEDSGWDTPAGLPIEIVPLLRPYGNYAGNTFTGKVLVAGKPAPGIEVEVEFYNQDGHLSPPTDYHITQVVKTDEAGVFSFSCPLSGWWGFSALSEADVTRKDPSGAEKPVEIGGVLWLYFDPLPGHLGR